MKSIFPVLSLLAVAVTAGPLVFDGHLLRDGDVEGRVAVLKHVTHVGDVPVGPNGNNAPRLRFVLLVPALHKVAGLSAEGLASQHLAHDPKHHAFTKLTGNELLVDLAALADCTRWHAVLLHVWDHVGGVAVHRALGHLKGDALKHLTDAAALADFVKTHAGLDLLAGLVRTGHLPAHVFTHHLHAAVKHLL